MSNANRLDKLMELPEGERGVRVQIQVGPERVKMEGDAVLVVVLQDSADGKGTHVNGGYFGPPEGIGLAAAHGLALAHDKGLIGQVMYCFGLSQMEKPEADDDAT